jgi:hypothetical protein
MTKYPDLFAALAAPFEPDELRARSQQGRQLHYITARVVMNRLDNVLGPENWWDEYVPSEHSVLCRLTVRLPDGTTLTKCDAGGYAGMSDSGDDGKSGYSDSFKRAAVKFGVGRYLYRDGVPAYAHQTSPSRPAREPESAEPAKPASAEPSAPAPGGSGPRTGRALFAWTKEQDERYEAGLLKYLGGWAKLHDFPARMVEWDAEQVSQAYAEACRKLQPFQIGRTEAYEHALAN